MTLKSFASPRIRLEPIETGQGDHICLVYEEDPVAWIEGLFPFIRQGLMRGERCVYVADDETLDEVAGRLGELGLAVDQELSSGALGLWTPEQWRRPTASNSIKRVGHIWTYIQEALEAGFSGIRFIVDKSWYENPDIEVDRIKEWESTIDAVFTPEVPARMICQYGQHRVRPCILEAGLATHPTVLVDYQSCPNPYYEAPLLLQSESIEYLPTSPSSRTDWMLSRLRLLQELKAPSPTWPMNA
jgi:hypothetical protein